MKQQQERKSNEINLNNKQKRYNSFKKHLLISANLALSGFYFGYSLSYFGAISFDDIIAIFDINMTESVAQGILIGAVPLGATIGSLLSVLLLKYLTPKWSLLAINIFSIITGCLILIQNEGLLFFCRICQGICSGCFTSIGPMILMSLAPKQISGTLGTLFQLQSAIGAFFGFALNWILQAIFINPSTYYYALFMFPVFTSILQSLIILFVFPYESPVYLIQQKKAGEAKQLFAHLYEQKFIESIYIQYENEIKLKKRKLENQQNSVNQSVEISERGSDKHDFPLIKNQVKLNRKSKIMRRVTAVDVSLLQPFSGINIIIGYAPPIVSSVFPSLKNVVPVTSTILPIIGALLCSFLLSRFGRKALLQLGTAVSIFSLSLMVIGFWIQYYSNNSQNQGQSTTSGVLIIIGMYIFLGNFGMTLGSVVWLYIPQIVSSSFVPIATTFNWSGSFITMVLFPILISILPDKNPMPMFLFLLIWCTIFLFLNRKLIIETKDRSAKQVQQDFQNLKLL